MSFKNKTQLINNINKVITSNNKSPTKKNLKKLDRMANTNYSFLDQTGGAIMKETLNILRENYKNNYAIKPNKLEKNFIENLLGQTAGGVTARGDFTGEMEAVLDMAGGTHFARSMSYKEKSDTEAAKFQSGTWVAVRKVKAEESTDSTSHPNNRKYYTGRNSREIWIGQTQGEELRGPPTRPNSKYKVKFYPTPTEGDIRDVVNFIEPQLIYKSDLRKANDAEISVAEAAKLKQEEEEGDSTTSAALAASKRDAQDQSRGVVVAGLSLPPPPPPPPPEFKKKDAMAEKDDTGAKKEADDETESPVKQEYDVKRLKIDFLVKKEEYYYLLKKPLTGGSNQLQARDKNWAGEESIANQIKTALEEAVEVSSSESSMSSFHSARSRALEVHAYGSTSGARSKTVKEEIAPLFDGFLVQRRGAADAGSSASFLTSAKKWLAYQQKKKDAEEHRRGSLSFTKIKDNLFKGLGKLDMDAIYEYNARVKEYEDARGYTDSLDKFTKTVLQIIHDSPAATTEAKATAQQFIDNTMPIVSTKRVKCGKLTKEKKRLWDERVSRNGKELLIDRMITCWREAVIVLRPPAADGEETPPTAKLTRLLKRIETFQSSLQFLLNELVDKPLEVNRNQAVRAGWAFIFDLNSKMKEWVQLLEDTESFNAFGSGDDLGKLDKRYVDNFNISLLKKISGTKMAAATESGVAADNVRTTVRPTHLEKGDEVKRDFRSEGKWLPAKITAIHERLDGTGTGSFADMKPTWTYDLQYRNSLYKMTAAANKLAMSMTNWSKAVSEANQTNISAELAKVADIAKIDWCNSGAQPKSSEQTWKESIWIPMEIRILAVEKARTFRERRAKSTARAARDRHTALKAVGEFAAGTVERTAATAATKIQAAARRKLAKRAVAAGTVERTAANKIQAAARGKLATKATAAKASVADAKTAKRAKDGKKVALAMQRLFQKRKGAKLQIEDASSSPDSLVQKREWEFDLTAAEKESSTTPDKCTSGWILDRVTTLKTLITLRPPKKCSKTKYFKFEELKPAHRDDARKNGMKFSYGTGVQTVSIVILPELTHQAIQDTTDKLTILEELTAKFDKQCIGEGGEIDEWGECVEKMKEIVEKVEKFNIPVAPTTPLSWGGPSSTRPRAAKTTSPIDDVFSKYRAQEKNKKKLRNSRRQLRNKMRQSVIKLAKRPLTITPIGEKLTKKELEETAKRYKALTELIGQLFKTPPAVTPGTNPDSSAFKSKSTKTPHPKMDDIKAVLADMMRTTDNPASTSTPTVTSSTADAIPAPADAVLPAAPSAPPTMPPASSAALPASPPPPSGVFTTPTISPSSSGAETDHLDPETLSKLFKKIQQITAKIDTPTKIAAILIKPIHRSPPTNDVQKEKFDELYARIATIKKDSGEIPVTGEKPTQKDINNTLRLVGEEIAVQIEVSHRINSDPIDLATLLGIYPPPSK